MKTSVQLLDPVALTTNLAEHNLARGQVGTVVELLAPDVALANWQAGGLRVPSTVRLSGLDCLEAVLLVHRLGRVTSADATVLKQAWATHVRLEF